MAARPSSSNDLVRIGTRGSPLALVQARQVAGALEQASGEVLKAEIVTFTTSGDQLTTERLINSGGKGLFTKEIDLALDDGRIDLAVHSLKDVPSVLPRGQEILAHPEREDPRDGFISLIAERLEDLPEGAIVGSASLRREAQTLAKRPDLQIVPFRGLVETRLRKLQDGEADATYLAMAGLRRLGLADKARPIPLDDMLPAACQGVIAVVGRRSALSNAIIGATEALDHLATRRAAISERAFLGALDGSCRTPIAAHLETTEAGSVFRGEVLTPDGSQRWSVQRRLDLDAVEDALRECGEDSAEEIREAAGGDLPAFVDL